MNPAFRTIALIGKYKSPEIAESLMTLADFLKSRGIDVLVEEGTAGLVGADGFPVAPYGSIGQRADLAIVLGGDGSMLAAARQLAESDVPLVGINQGRLGFMTDLARDDMIDSMADLLEGKFKSEQRFLLETSVRRGEAVVFQTRALNDVVVNKGDLGRMIEFAVSIDGEFIYNQRSDGLIVATPTGSTAYALSANGPILHPSVPGIALVPLCPHALSNRPITISDDSRIEIVLHAPHRARVHADGQEKFDLEAGDRVSVARSSRSIRFLHPLGYSYFAMLREKLHWSETPRSY
ncbi:MAG: NAD kinase [Rhodocyclaceae bacterium]|jgi:NAD+ kinase|uniref:NAD kinase n=1 Tax=Candidatus Desulfobacillus denitrificans TaxID=2608985 RepID=A0A809RP55_9PROT|nr:NAD kinase [Rhodocyclaceae bacterium]OQY65133.1 MAG: NAD kinase [Rhodocyclaceae bacterium UTPRO2]BBO21372.1 NAD kinase [Candidatus Desulfobacillus denitrificans]GIK46656.1 MAG: NAD kinase [Betaproteobacteria bacterium]MCL4723974.1 NAD kinase [Rhodocyclaceae bacterium]